MAQGFCSVNQCSRDAYARGWCFSHYRRWYRTGEAGGPIPEAMPEAERFWSKVAMRGDCWVWTSSRNKGGYGQVSVGGRAGTMMLAHRYAYEQMVGEIPEGLHLDHLCRVRECVNPYHLEPVTPRVNALRGLGPSAVAATVTQCPRGHEYNASNTRIQPKGSRVCRACDREKWHERQSA